ncbi:helix-turn-helix domain-containing protein [Tissierella pigra]|uniref:Helix-turn-helix domain-containing protein n=1 Tax=Tissierella pigra TaxID=2607614 RepID=A0A6N7Y0S9_9FIRM|nr:helix-turn-helix domain-containing protein [Tissierella pigra]MSU02464.1 helix-turn-helix domain-containing protein [Tissierella pigra]
MNDSKKTLNYKDVGLRIRLEREKLGLSREKFAELVGLSSFYIGQLERGDRKMSVDTLVNISSVLNISVDYLLYGYNYYMENISISEAFNDIYKVSVDNELKELLNILEGSSKEQISLLKDIYKLILPSIKK